MTDPRWADMVAGLAPLGDLAELSWQPDDPLTRAQVRRQLMMNLSLAYFCYFQSDTAHPDFLPFRSSVHTLQPNPDDCYLKAQIDGAGTYHIVGERGTVRLLTFTISRNVLGFTDAPGEMLLEFDGDTITQSDGRIDLVLSAERPTTHRGAWIQLPANAESVLVRHRSYHWGTEREARLAISRLDAVPLKPSLTAQQIDAGIADMVAFAERMTRHWLSYLRKLRDRLPPHQVEATSFAGGVQAQQYWQCWYELAPDEALILETEIPDRARYWNVQLNDMIWNTVEYIYRQSSLNGAQARIDEDGRFRAVISQGDLGVANWLDTAGHDSGTLVGRWYECDTYPVPHLAKVRLSDVRDHLPPGTPAISGAERAERLKARIVGAQLRRRW